MLTFAFMSFGKHHESMYDGSMIGAGAEVFAVWGYVISKMKPGKDGMQVELNPKLLAFTLGEPEQEIRDAIVFLCAPDPHSRTKDEAGRRLVRLDEFAYKVVNGMKYRWIRDEETRRQQNRDAQARYREKKKQAPERDPIASAPPGKVNAVLGKILQKGVEQSPELGAQLGVSEPPQARLGTTRIEE